MSRFKDWREEKLFWITALAYCLRNIRPEHIKGTPYIWCHAMSHWDNGEIFLDNENRPTLFGAN